MRADAAVVALGALAHEHRLAVFRLLIEAGPAGLSAGAIAGRLGLVPSSLTFHTQALRRAGLISRRRASRQLIYAADFPAMEALIGYLSDNCCGEATSCGPVCGAAVGTPRSRRRHGRVRSTRRKRNP